MFRSLKFFLQQSVAPDEIIARLAAFGYKRMKKVERPGEYAQRGGIVDIFPVNFDGPVRMELDDNQILKIASFNLATGESIWDHQMVILLPQKTHEQTPFLSTTPLEYFVDIKNGDYVVHNNHGIGKFLGLSDATVDPRLREHLVIEYRGGDKLYVPKHDMHLVQKYAAFSKKPPRLFKLGTKEWQRVRNHIQKRIQLMAAELLHTQALRTSLPGHAFLKDTPWQAEFEKTFPFQETPDQITSTQEVKTDMESPYPMDRLLCGDVGYGKTEVAMRAAFKAVMDNKQVAMLVPTTILAEQHHYNFSKRLEGLPVKVAMLSRFRTKHEQKEILQGLAQGKVDIVIGTHRLLSKDIDFKDLGLLIIDEEQRFGVRAKERLKHLRVLVDVLTLTATPIPRTLYMSLAGARDMSIISTPPQNRYPVTTNIIEFDEDTIEYAIQKELKRKGQVFFLHNRVEDIERIGNLIKRLSHGGRIAIGHGQMPGRLLEEIMLRFLSGDIDVLVCTTIIESGIDIPNANTLIVNGADKIGLADLHQLRGRVGRFTRRAFAYFIVPPKDVLSFEAKARIKALERYSELGAGFQIAFEDLKIRGAGNLLGAQQHGYISSVGFDLYCRLLKESIEHLKHIKGQAHAIKN